MNAHEVIRKDVYNVGYQNMSIMDIAKLVREVVLEQFENKKEIEIITTESDDNRSYHINSDKLKVSGLNQNIILGMQLKLMFGI